MSLDKVKRPKRTSLGETWTRSGSRWVVEVSVADVAGQRQKRLKRMSLGEIKPVAEAAGS